MSGELENRAVIIIMDVIVLHQNIRQALMLILLLLIQAMCHSIHM